MPTTHHLIVSLTIAAVTMTSQAEAGCFDWLFGPKEPVVVPYVAPVTVPVAANYGSVPVTANYGSVPVTANYGSVPVTANYGSVPVTANYGRVPANFGAIPVAPRQRQNGVVQMQRPVYNNPSVYTGRPVVSPSAQTVYRAPFTSDRSYVPITQSIVGIPPATTQVVVAPQNVARTSYQSAYGAQQTFSTTVPGQPLTTAVPVGTPGTALPATAVTPLFAAAPPPRRSGLSRFFGSFLGTEYRSSYYSAPVTYYRPVTMIDPVSGAPVTIQQPCTSTVQRLQRTPVASFQLPTHAGCPTPQAGCAPTGCPTPSYGSSTTVYPSTPGVTQPNVGQSGGVGQVGGFGSPGMSATPIPSTDPRFLQPGNVPSGQPGFGPPPSAAFGTQPMNTQPLNAQPLNAQPLSPAPSNGAPLMGAPPVSGDRTPIQPPDLNTRTNLQETSTPPQPAAEPAAQPSGAPEPKELPDSDPKSYWDTKEAEGATASLPANQNRPTGDPKSLITPRYSGLAPIRAPEGYESPFRERNVDPVPTTNVKSSGVLEAPPLPPRTQDARDFDPSDATSASARLSVPVRDASMTHNRSIQPIAPATSRASSGWRTIRQP